MRSLRTDVSYKDVNWRTLVSLLPYLKDHKARILLALACLIGAKAASVGLPFILKHIIDALDVNQNHATIIAIPVILLSAYGCVRFASVIFGELRDTIFGRVTERAMREIGLKVFRHLHSLDLEFHLNRRTGGLSRDIERGTNGISFLMRFMIFNIIPTLLEIGMIIIILCQQYSIWYAFIIGIAVALYIAFSVFATERRTQFVREMNKAESETSTRAIDSLLNYETVKYFTNEESEAAHYDKELADWEVARQKNRLSLFFLNGGQAFIIALAATAAMTLAAFDVTEKRMTLGDFALINAFMMQIFMPLNFLGFVYREMKGSMANIEKMFDLLKTSARVTDETSTPLLLSQSTIEFKNVSFHYEKERPIIQNLSFTVSPQQKVAIVGNSGAGKSTIFKLLFRFYDCTEGEILIDGQNIRQVTQHSLRNQIGVIPQETVLFNMSILENIRYGKLEASDDAVKEAIKLAHLEEFIASLPNGANTLVGERGLKLSGGEKQRVAIARAILKNPPIMIFDEATSSLDSHGEKAILQAIKEVSSAHTSIVIAHRLSTITDADNIIVLNKGSIIEQGNHAELLAKQGAYFSMWQAQQHNA